MATAADSGRTMSIADTILPIGALLTAIGMTTAGAAVIREHRWHGWRRFTPLTMGLYPVVFMFPLAATDAPVEPSIALWALPTIAVGIAALPSQPTTSPTRPTTTSSPKPSTAVADPG